MYFLLKSKVDGSGLSKIGIGSSCVFVPTSLLVESKEPKLKAIFQT